MLVISNIDGYPQTNNLSVFFQGLRPLMEKNCNPKESQLTVLELMILGNEKVCVLVGGGEGCEMVDC